VSDFEKFLVILGIFFGGVFLETVVLEVHSRITGRRAKEHHVALGRFLFFLIFTALAFTLVVGQHGLTVISAFLIFAGLGTALEWFLDFLYELMVGEPLWSYHLYTITKHTSLLAALVWGIAGILFLFLAQTVHSFISVFF
jgi:hypothetical protein